MFTTENRPRNPVTQKCLDLLLQIEPGQVLTYDRLSEFVGAKMPESHRSQLAAARAKVEHQHGRWFKAARVGKIVVGMKRMDGGATCAEAEHMRRSMHTASNRNRVRLQRMTDEEVGILPASLRAKGIAGERIFGAVSRLTHGKTWNRIERDVMNATKLPRTDTAKRNAVSKTLFTAAQGKLFTDEEMDQPTRPVAIVEDQDDA